MKKTYITILAILALAFIIGLYFYPLMPDQIASHWDTRGQVNGYMGKFWGVFLLPIIMAIISVLYFIIPKIDPLKTNISSFRKYYDSFWIFILLFLLYIYSLTLAWNIGFRFDFNLFISPALALLFYFIGMVIERSKRNWFMGIRTPWTLSSDVVWDKTHKLGGRLFKIAAIFPLIAMLFPSNWTLGISILIPVLGIVLGTFIYSYIEYKNLK